MAANIYVDRIDSGEITVRVMTGIVGDRTKIFPAEQRLQAEVFAESKMGRKGMICSTLDMTPAQLGAHRAREARIAVLCQKVAA